MKRYFALSVVLTFVVAGLWAWTANAEPKGPKTITVTEKQLDEMVQRRHAQMVLKEERSLHEEVLQGKHWHTANFNGLVYTIYTGPGDVVCVAPSVEK